MFHIAYNKQTKFILYTFFNGSIGVEKPTPQQHLSIFCDNNDLLVGDYETVELPCNPKAQYIIGRDKFDETDNTIYADPDWVAPTSAE
jgi:hypothetical protein